MPSSAPAASRLASLDVFRGATVALMILVNNPGSWRHLYAPLAHARWHGLTPTDCVFPFFLFAVGNALALVLPAQAAGGGSAFAAKVARRTLVIFGLGLLLNAAPFVRWSAAGELVARDWSALRLMGVLQRIALAYAAAAAIVWLLGRRGDTRRVLVAAGVLLVGYWAACIAFGARGDPYGLHGFFGTALDRALFGPRHLYQGEGVPFDPEGLASTWPAVAQVLLGWWVGEAVRTGHAALPAARAGLVIRLFLVGFAWLALGYLWQLGMPLNKKIWTSSYVMVTSGLAVLGLAVLVHALDGAASAGPRPAWARFFEPFGRNALFVFVLSGLVPRLLALARWPDAAEPGGWTSPLPFLARHLFAPIGGSDLRVGSLLFACANLLVYWAIAAALDRRRLYIRI